MITNSVALSTLADNQVSMLTEVNSFDKQMFAIETNIQKI